MARYIAFLRALNVGGHTIRMEDLRGHFEALGLAKVETFIASGNVIFESKDQTKPLRKKLEERLAKTLGYEVATFLRTDAEVHSIVAHVPFPAKVLAAATALNVAFFHEPLDGEAMAKLMALRTELDDFHVHGSEVYWLCRMKQSESTFSNKVLERALKLKTTFRGMNTIQKLAAKYPPEDGT